MAKSGSPKEAKRVGRYTPPQETGRVTQAVDHTTDHSPSWFGWIIIDLILFGLIVITMNYLQVLPGAASGWYLLTGLVALFSSFYLATRYK